MEATTKFSAGAEAHVLCAGISARLKSCPKKKLLFRLGCQGRDLDFESEVFQAVDQAQSLFVFGAVVEVACAEILVKGSVFEHVVGSSENRSSDRADGFLCPAAGAYSQILGLEITTFGAAGAPCALNQCRLEPGRAFLHARGTAFARALVVFGAESRPTNQVARSLKAAACPLRETDAMHDRSILCHPLNALK